jgi:hypothetical protein
MHKQNYFAYIVVVQICELDSDQFTNLDNKE